jgi:hypothetical protein
MMAMRRLNLFALVLVAVFASAMPAQARSDPKHFYLPTTPVDLDPSFCGFPIHLEFPVNNEYAKATTLDDGTVVWHVTGALVDVISSSTTTITQNVSGPADLYFAPDGSLTIVARGPAILPLPPEQQAETGLPGLVLLSGLTVVRFNPDGSSDLLRQEGDVVSLCDELA